MSDLENYFNKPLAEITDEELASISTHIPVGYCQCGCGGKTTIHKYTGSGGRKAGVPMKYISGHNSRVDHPNYKGGYRIDEDGYLLTHTPNRPRAVCGYVREHLLVIEKALGKPIPNGAVAHHVDGTKLNNGPKNLVLCQDRAYHNLLHRRERALKICGNANWVKCSSCREYDDPKNMIQANYHVTGLNGGCSGARARKIKKEGDSNGNRTTN